MVDGVKYFLEKFMANSNLPEDFYLSLTEFLIHAKSQIVALSYEFGLSVMQALTLLLIGDDPRPMNSLCKLFHCDASNITGIIDGLEQKQLIARAAHPHDRRVRVIKLLPAGRKLRQTLAHRLAENSNELFYGLNSAELNQLVRLIHKIADANYNASLEPRSLAKQPT